MPIKKVVKKSIKSNIPSITIYKTQTCPYCHMAEEFLKQNKFKFKSIDVGRDEKSAQILVEKSGQRGVPVIDINGQIIIGFDKGAIRKALNIKL